MTSEAPRQRDLDRLEKSDARRRESPSAAVVYEAIRSEAESELKRPLMGIAWSALAAGLSMGFSFVAQALLHGYIPDTSWRPAVTSFGYSIGFLFVVLGRQQLFTENTLAPVLEVLRKTNTTAIIGTLKLWLVVLLGNMAGTALFAYTLANFDILHGNADMALSAISATEYGTPFLTMMIRAVFAGWLIAMMLWLMPFAETARVGVIIVVTYVIGLAHFPHIVAGSVAAIYAVLKGDATWFQFFFEFFAPTLAGNMLGGIMLVAAINYAQLA
ncbi:MAG: formate/nitrite transporter family protein, partial [Ketobacter sp.]